MKRGRPKGSRDSRPRARRSGTARSASPTVRQLFEIMNGTVTQMDVAVELGYSRATICNYKRGRNTPSIMAVEEIAAALGYRVQLVKERNDDDERTL